MLYLNNNKKPVSLMGILVFPAYIDVCVCLTVGGQQLDWQVADPSRKKGGFIGQTGGYSVSWALSSIGRALAEQTQDHWFKPGRAHFSS